VLVMAPLMATVTLTWRRWWWALSTIVLLGAGLVTGLRLELNATYAGMESEHVALSAMTGLTATGGDGVTTGGVDDWRRSAEIIDGATTDHDLIAADSSAAFTVLLFTDHLDRFAIPEDRDFEQLLGLTDTRFTYLVVSGSTNSSTGADLQLAAIANGSAGSNFVKVADLPGIGTLYGRTDVVELSDASDGSGSPSA
jgi:hypothetical protein